MVSALITIPRESVTSLHDFVAHIGSEPDALAVERPFANAGTGDQRRVHRLITATDVGRHCEMIMRTKRVAGLAVEILTAPKQCSVI